jgi:hypothetical protein
MEAKDDRKFFAKLVRCVLVYPALVLVFIGWWLTNKDHFVTEIRHVRVGTKIACKQFEKRDERCPICTMPPKLCQVEEAYKAKGWAGVHAAMIQE